MQANNETPDNNTNSKVTVTKDIQERLWLDSNLTKFDDVLRENYDKSIEDFSEAIIGYLCTLTEAMRGAFFVRNTKKNCLEFRGGYACTEKSMGKTSFDIGESVVGQVAKSYRSSFLKDIPLQNVYVNSSSGQLSARSMAVIPLIFNEEVYGVLEFVYLHNLDEKYLDLLNRLGRSAAAMLQSIQNNIKTKKLLHESLLQAERLRAAEEEMRQNNEELVATQEEMQRKSKELEYLLQESKAKGQEMREVKEKLEKEQKKLRQEQANFNRMTSAVPGMIFQYQVFPNGTHQLPYTSSGIADIFGENLHDFEDIEVFKNLIHPDDLPSFEESMAEAVETFSLWQWEGRINLQGGAVKWVAGSARPEMLDDKSVLFSGIFTDITTMKEKETFIQTINERFELINKGSAQGIWDMDIPENEILNQETPVWWSGQCSTLLGYQESALAERLGSLYDRVHPTSRGLFFEHFHHHLRNYKSVKPFEKAFRFRTNNNRYRWFLLRGTIQRNSTGKPLRMAGALVDITRYKTLEKKLDKYKIREKKMLAKIGEQEGRNKTVKTLETVNAELVQQGPFNGGHNGKK
ncbi:PAS domain-containing protein [Microscilla marina]|uniref:histidine kinase n=1 Tax=Microscilla marina ATCC 23134 TaxID=313606 RepID=A1ZCB7_MICM2|nr:PAS domain-containing protein [Microscilla marina]EAY31919.1 two-component hybrid sensor and regulator, putative [Microscilla marina ATCC 23134]